MSLVNESLLETILKTIVKTIKDLLSTQLSTYRMWGDMNEAHTHASVFQHICSVSLTVHNEDFY